MADVAIGPDEVFGTIDWLKGLKVLEVTTGVAAPLIGRVLADLGAEVTKLESRAKLDVNRMRVPRPDDPEGFPASEAFQLLHEANVGKQSITLNLKDSVGRQLFVDLLQDTDVFIENFAPGWLERLGLSAAEIVETAPRLIMLSASGYGQTGPLRTQRAYAPVMTSLAGIEGLIGYANGDVMGACSLALADLNCSFHGVYLILAALHGLRGTGRGQHIDLSQTEACVSLIGEAFVEQQLGVRVPAPRGNAGTDGELWSLIRTENSDTWVAAGTDRHGHNADVLETLAKQDRRPSTAKLLATLSERGFESAPVLTPVQVAGDDAFGDRGFLQHVTHPLEPIGELTVTSLPWHLSGKVATVSSAAPMLGHDTERFFRHRLDAGVYEDYADQGVFYLMGAMLDSVLSVEVGRTRAAAFAGKLLADAGSEVIALQDAGRVAGLSDAARVFMDVDKDVVTWSEDGDRVLVEELLPHADLFITDIAVDELARRGLDWATLHARVPKLSYVHLEAVGPVGDDRTSHSDELAMQAISGLMHVVGDPDREPLALPYSLGSVQLGLHGVAAATVALYSAAATDIGKLVEISGAEVLASYVRIYGAVASYYGVELRRDGRRAPGSGGRWPFGIFPCRDGWVAMICRSAREWESLLAMMGNPDWSREDRYRDLYAIAISYPEEIDELVSPWLLQHTRDQLLQLAQEFAVPVAPIRSVAEVLVDPQLRDARHFFDQLTTATGQVLHLPGRPWAAGPRVQIERVPSVIDIFARATAASSGPDTRRQLLGT